MKKRIEPPHFDSSSSVGFFPASFDDSSQSKTLGSTAESSSDDMYEFAQNNPVKIDCWRENICSDLAVFAHNKLRQSANLVPHTSPKKKPYNHELIAANKTASMEAKLSHSLFFYTPPGQELQKLNQKIVAMDAQSGRSYQKLIDAARTFRELLEIKGVGNCEILFKKCGVQNALELASNIQTVPPVVLLMFLFLVDKYPTAPQNTIMAYFKKCLQEQDSDCYVAFKFLDNYCYEQFPTKHTLENYMEEDQLTSYSSFNK